jgi:multidrug efflux pump subunit AcrA (membrane-fusion protein)
MKRDSALIRTIATTLILSIAGCQQNDEGQVAPKKPRPVEVRLLEKTGPPDASLVSATVGSWKTEQIGFEVDGRIEWVAEPNTEIEGRVKDGEGETIVQGTRIARIDDERYQLRVKTAQAKIVQAQQRIAAAKIEIDKTIPAQIRSAEAEEKMTGSALDRSKQLKRQNATSQSDLDADSARYETALANLDQLDATLKAKEADLQALKSQQLEAEQSLQDAERDLENCTLYSSFRGQIASTAVVPGSVVSAGQEVVTIQMMNPIKVEVEVSAEDSRRLRNRERIPVTVARSDGSSQILDGFLYLIDPIADASMRTYTLTLLLMNEKESDVDVSAEVATTDQTWRLDFDFLPGREEGMYFIDEKAILTDDSGSYLWKIENAEVEQPMPTDRMLKVSKLPVELGPAKIPFLGNWVFQQITFDEANFDPKRNLVTSKLRVQSGDPESWNGDTVLLTSEDQWKLRPGDVVRVDLSNEDTGVGYFVPMDTIVRQGDRSFLIVVDDSSENPTVRRQEIQVVTSDENLASSSIRQVKPIDGADLDAVRYVSRGAHYLRDGERVNLVSPLGASQ